MAALTITEIIRQTLNSDQVSGTDLTDTYIPIGEGIFEAITQETLTIAADTTGTLTKDMAVAYLAICAYYTVKKEGHMVGSRDDQVQQLFDWFKRNKGRFSEFLFTGSSCNLGANGGRNLAYRLAEHDRILILDNDIVLPNDSRWLEKLEQD